MSNDQIALQIKELLGRNLFLERDIKGKIETASSETQAKILPILAEIDEKQTGLFREILKKNPHFFADLENMAIHEALKKLVAQEESAHFKEIKNAEAELAEALEQI